MKSNRSVGALRARAVASSLFPPTALQNAIDRLGFVQADPIRSPARAQDLILRHRVHGYHAGDLERLYASLEIEEDYLYAYGFLSKPVWQLLHPRKAPRVRVLEKKVLELVLQLGEAHPRALEVHLGKRRVGRGRLFQTTTNALRGCIGAGYSLDGGGKWCPGVLSARARREPAPAERLPRSSGVREHIAHH